MVCRESETRDRRESIGEFRESSEKITEGLAELEKFRGVQRYLVCHVSSVGEVQKQGQNIALCYRLYKWIGCSVGPLALTSTLTLTSCPPFQSLACSIHPLALHIYRRKLANPMIS